MIALVALAAVYGVGPVFARYLSNGLGLYEQWYLRFAIGTLMGAIAFHRYISWRKFLRLPAREWLVLLFRIAVGQIITLGVFTLATQRAKIGVISFMEVLPVSSLLGILLFGERLSAYRGLLMALSFVGAAVVVVTNPHDLLRPNTGALLALLATALYSLMLVTRRWHTDALNNHEITIATSGISAAALYVLSLFLYHRWTIPATHWHVNFMIMLIAASGLLMANNFLSNYGFDHVSAVLAGNILSLEEFFGPLFGLLVYGEVLSPRSIAGGLIILLSVLLMNQSARREHKTVQVPVLPD